MVCWLPTQIMLYVRHCPLLYCLSVSLSHSKEYKYTRLDIYILKKNKNIQNKHIDQDIFPWLYLFIIKQSASLSLFNVHMKNHITTVFVFLLDWIVFHCRKHSTLILMLFVSCIKPLASPDTGTAQAGVLARHETNFCKDKSWIIANPNEK